MHSSILKAALTGAMICFGAPVLAATTIDIDHPDMWSEWMTYQTPEKRPGIFKIVLSNYDQTEVSDFHIQLRKSRHFPQHVFVPVTNKVPPFENVSYTDRNRLYNLWGGTYTGSDFLTITLLVNNAEGNGADTVYYRYKPTTSSKEITETPLPAALPALLTGFGGLALVRSRRRKTTADQDAA